MTPDPVRSALARPSDPAPERAAALRIAPADAERFERMLAAARGRETELREAARLETARADDARDEAATQARRTRERRESPGPRDWTGSGPRTPTTRREDAGQTGRSESPLADRGAVRDRAAAPRTVARTGEPAAGRDERLAGRDGNPSRTPGTAAGETAAERGETRRAGDDDEPGGDAPTSRDTSSRPPAATRRAADGATPPGEGSRTGTAAAGDGGAAETTGSNSRHAPRECVAATAAGRTAASASSSGARAERAAGATASSLRDGATGLREPALAAAALRAGPSASVDAASAATAAGAGTATAATGASAGSAAALALLQGSPAPTPSGATPAAVPGSTAAQHAPIPLHTPQFAGALAERVLALARGAGGEAEVQVSPGELGPIRIALRVEDGQATIAFGALAETTRAAIEQSMPLLETLFAEHGLTVADARLDAGLTQRLEHEAAGDRHGGPAPDGGERGDGRAGAAHPGGEAISAGEPAAGAATGATRRLLSLFA